MKSCEALFLKPIAQSIPAMLSLWPRRCYVSGPCCVVESCSDNALSLSAIIMFTPQKMPGDNLQKLLLQGHLVSFWGRPGYLLPWRSCCGDSFDPCNQHHASFWNVNFIADRPAGYVSQQQQEAFRTAASRKRFVHSPQDLRGEGLGKAVGSGHWWEALRARTSSERCQAWGVFGHMAPAGVPKGSVLCTISPRWVCQLDLMGCNYFRSSANRSLLM